MKRKSRWCGELHQPYTNARSSVKPNGTNLGLQAVALVVPVDPQGSATLVVLRVATVLIARAGRQIVRCMRMPGPNWVRTSPTVTKPTFS